MKENFWVEEVNGQPLVPTRSKRKVVQRKIQFIGWGSKPLLEFLQSIGEDSGKRHSKLDLVKTITRYVKDNFLTSKEKKKKIVCDQRLTALFGKKSLSLAKIYYLLEDHLAENHDESDDDDASAEESYDEKSALELQTRQRHKSDKVPKTPKSCFAAVIPENIKLVYLKGSLVQDLFKFREDFEAKVVGSFVRLRSDRNDIFQKHRFHLEQVTGIKYVTGAADTVDGVLLQVSNCLNDAPINILSDENFLEEECEDLRDRVKSGSIKRLTVEELEMKAQLLHSDIMNHWIPREISLLQKLIDHANEKGRRKELDRFGMPETSADTRMYSLFLTVAFSKSSSFLDEFRIGQTCPRFLDFTKFDFLQRRKLLQTPAEQEKLLSQTPTVIAEEPDPENVPAREKPQVSGARDLVSLNSHSLWGGKECVVDGGLALNDPDGSKDLVSPSQLLVNGSKAGSEHRGGFEDGVIAANDPSVSGARDLVSPNSHASQCGNESFADKIVAVSDPYGTKDIVSPSELILNGSKAGTEEHGGIRNGVIAANDPADDHPFNFLEIDLRCTEPAIYGDYQPTQIVDLDKEEPPQKLENVVVIDLSDDELPDENEDQIKAKIWHYVDPQGTVQGPFSLYDLKIWSDADYFYPGFAVWRSGQSEQDSVLLVDLLRQNFGR